MAVEAKRVYGYRQVHGLYLVGGILSAPCDRLPLPLEVCPVCGSGIKVSRVFTKINAAKIWGPHDKHTVSYKALDKSIVVTTDDNCRDTIRPCFVCDPKDEVGFIMLIWEKNYSTPADFIKEGVALGVSKRIPFIPKELELGKTVVFFAHHKACVDNGLKLGTDGQVIAFIYKTGIFAAFIPQKVEGLYWESELKGKKGKKLLEKLEKRGITPVSIPDGDKDHA